MIDTGEELKGKKHTGIENFRIISKIEKIKEWLKTPQNPFVYFAISIARAKKYSRVKAIWQQ